MKIYFPNPCCGLCSGGSKCIGTSFRHAPGSFRRKMVVTMQLCAFLLLTSLQVSFAAATDAQTSVSFTGKDVPLEQVFASVKKQTGYTFVYYTDVLQGAHKVTLDVRDLSIEQFLDVCLKDEPLTYKVIGQTVMIAKKEIRINVLPEGDPIASTVKGRVTNEKGEPLAGASVLVKGSRRGTMTGSDGRFTLKGATVGAILVVSYAGFTPEEVTVQNSSELLLTLQHSNNPLDEVKVIAYGTITERFNTGDVTNVTAEEIERQPINNPLLALEGRVPGLFITQNTGLPGSGVSIQIRGQNSIASGNDPFYVIDGVPYTSQLLPNLGGILGTGSGNAQNSGSPLSFINPDDIESISVLKDAAATAIYGTRAANGAILITTKKGKAGPTKVDINLQNGWGKVTRKMNLLNDQQYLEMRHEAINNDGLTTGSGDYDLNGSWDSTRSTDWQKALIGGTAQYANLTGTISGGDVNTQYLIDGTYHRETTVFPERLANEKGSFHFSLNNISSNKKFRTQLSGGYLLGNTNLPDIDLTSTAVTLAPDAPSLYNSDGTIDWSPTTSGASSFYFNPMANLLQRFVNKTNNLVANSLLSYEVFRGLEIKSNFGYTNMQVNETVTIPLTSIPPEVQPLTMRSAVYTNNNIHSWIVEPQIHYNRNIANGKFDFLLGSSINQSTSNGLRTEGVGYNSDQVLADIHSAASVYILSNIVSTYKYNALFGRLDYNWEDKYLIDLTARRDGSSRFGSANQFHDFAAVGAGWLFSQEHFIQDNLSFLSFGKLRGSYGTTGNDQIGDYQFMSLYTPVSYSQPYQGVTGLNLNGLTNPYLEWEVTKKSEVGLELGFLKDRILLNSNYFINRSSNELLPYNLPIITGFGSVTENFPAKIQNSGWEFTLNTVNVKSRNFTWKTSINLSVSRNKLLAFPNIANSAYATTLVVGKPITIQHVFHFLGVNPETGVYQFGDQHGNLTSIPDTSYTANATSIVDRTPTFFGGIENVFQYKGFSLNILFQVVDRRGPDYFFGNLPGAFGAGLANQPTTVLKRWQQPGDITRIQRYNSDYSLSESFGDALNSDGGWSNAFYARLKNLAISWQLPKSWMGKTHLQMARLYIQGQNLLTFTHYPGLDPETLSSTTLPPLRVLTVGLQVNL